MLRTCILQNAKTKKVLKLIISFVQVTLILTISSSPPTSSTKQISGTMQNKLKKFSNVSIIIGFSQLEALRVNYQFFTDLADTCVFKGNNLFKEI